MALPPTSTGGTSSEGYPSSPMASVWVIEPITNIRRPVGSRTEVRVFFRPADVEDQLASLPAGGGRTPHLHVGGQVAPRTELGVPGPDRHSPQTLPDRTARGSAKPVVPGASCAWVEAAASGFAPMGPAWENDVRVPRIDPGGARPRVIALGRPAGGDDSVGLAVADRVRDRAGAAVDVIAPGVITDLVELLQHDAPVIIVDAVQSRLHAAGEVLELTVDDLDGLRSVSCHGVTVRQAIELARTLAPEAAIEPQIVGVCIEGSRLAGERLSRAVSDAVESATTRILRSLGL